MSLTTTQSEVTINDLVRRSLRYLRRIFPVFVISLAGALCWGLLNSNESNAIAFVGVAVPATAIMWFWIYNTGGGLPFVAMLALQTLLWYGLPLVVNHESLQGYSPPSIFSAALQVALFLVVLGVVYGGLINRPVRRPESCLGFGFSEGTGSGTATLAVGGLALCVAFEGVSLTGDIWWMTASLPSGSISILRTIVAVISLACTLVLAYLYGRKRLPSLLRLSFAGLWALLFSLKVASILISGALGITVAALTGLYLGSGRVPWKFLVGVLVVVSFLNVSKRDMRNKYWRRDKASLTVEVLPAYFAEWSGRSFDILTGQDDRVRQHSPQTIIDRVSSIQMLLYVQRKVERDGLSLLEGDTYTGIPALLVPRVLWPGKPRSHEGQVLLNVHFERQMEHETFNTYIAWGLLPEAYGNFGPYWGPISLGLFLGIVLTWLERWTAGYPIVSLQGIIACVIFMHVATTTEAVASIWVTSLFQSLVALVFASIPFLHRQRIAPPVPTAPLSARQPTPSPV